VMSPAVGKKSGPKRRGQHQTKRSKRASRVPRTIGKERGAFRFVPSHRKLRAENTSHSAIPERIPLNYTLWRRKGIPRKYLLWRSHPAKRHGKKGLYM